MKDDGTFAFAGLWERWKPEDDADPLDRVVPGVAVNDLLRPYAADEMTATAVSTHVNSVRNDDPECIKPVS